MITLVNVKMNVPIVIIIVVRGKMKVILDNAEMGALLEKIKDPRLIQYDKIIIKDLLSLIKRIDTYNGNSIVGETGYYKRYKDGKYYGRI